MRDRERDVTGDDVGLGAHLDEGGLALDRVGEGDRSGRERECEGEEARGR